MLKRRGAANKAKCANNNFGKGKSPFDKYKKSKVFPFKMTIDGDVYEIMEDGVRRI